ncbi:MAG: hypothetical protein EAX81_02970 [Candidatus Thorarchaeota archaeon]|nr:hypothetical protein [Candidatus Thorarchaeota archaeon]
MTEEDSLRETRMPSLRIMAKNTRDVMKEPILQSILEKSILTKTQLETLLIDLVIEDEFENHISYKEKASLRSKAASRSRGVSRGAFNRTLNQARKNITRCFYTMLLLAYLGLFEFTFFSPFEELATRIEGYRRIRDTLAGKTDLSSEEIESYQSAERTILSALDSLSTSLSLKSRLSRRKTGSEIESER